MYKYSTKHADVKKKIANIFVTIQICAGKPDQGQVQMGSCWDANSGKEGAKRLMLPVKFQPQPLEQRYRHVQITFHILQISRFFLFLGWKDFMVGEVIAMGIGFWIHS